MLSDRERMVVCIIMQDASVVIPPREQSDFPEGRGSMHSIVNAGNFSITKLDML